MRTLKLFGLHLFEVLAMAALLGFALPTETANARKKVGFSSSSSKKVDADAPKKKGEGDADAAHPDAGGADADGSSGFSIKSRFKSSGGSSDEKDEKRDAAAADKAKAAEPDPNVPHVKPSEELDDFGRRAQEALKAENAVRKPHPLQEKYPDYNVVVCEAGCGPGGKIVFKEKKSARQPVDYVEMATTSDAGSSGQDDAVLNVVCAAGCYDSKKVTRAVELPRLRSTAKTRAEVDGAQKSSNGESGKWLARINEEKSFEAAAGREVAAKASTLPAAPVSVAVMQDKPSQDGPNLSQGATQTSVAARAEEAPVVSLPTVVAHPADVKPAEPPAVSLAATAAPGAQPATNPTVVAKAKAEEKPAAAAQVEEPAKSSDALPPAASQVEAAKVEAPAAPTQTGTGAAKDAPAAAEKPAVVAEAKPPSGASSEKTISVASDDAEMNAAITKARNSLGTFWSTFEKPGTGEADFALKVAISDKGQTEHFWLTNIERKDGKTAGIISNTPTLVKSVTQGQRYEFSEDQISDWLYKRNGKMVGNETMRPLLKRMPREQAEAYRSLYETP
jgi:uncharacterized protein YegJ (DUF2314 family)